MINEPLIKSNLHILTRYLLVIFNNIITHIMNINSNRYIINKNIHSATLIYLVVSMMIDYIIKITFIYHFFPNCHSILQNRDKIYHYYVHSLMHLMKSMLKLMNRTTRIQVLRTSMSTIHNSMTTI